MERISIVLGALLLGGCATSNVTGFKDPQARVYGSAVIFSNAPIQEALALSRELCPKLGVQRCYDKTDVFPPTRSYSTDEMMEILRGQGIETAVFVTTTSDVDGSRVVGYQNFSNTTGTATGTAQVYGNTAYGTVNSNSTTTGTSVPIVSFSRSSAMNVRVIDVSNGITAWVGDVRTSGQGMLGVSDSVFMSTATSKLAEALRPIYR